MIRRTLGDRHPEIAELKKLLYIAGMWSGAIDTSDVITPEYVYWTHDPLIDGLTTKEAISAVRSKLNVDILGTPAIATNLVKDVPVNDFSNIDDIFTTGPNGTDPRFNQMYVVPNFVVKHPSDVYGDVHEAALNLMYMDLPVPLTLSWDDTATITRIRINKEAAEPLRKVLAHMAPLNWEATGIFITGGCYNKRRIRGGSRWSSHSWGTSIDFDPLSNQMGLHIKDTAFGKSARWQYFAKVLWHYGFRTLERDLMHWQYVPEGHR